MSRKRKALAEAGASPVKKNVDEGASMKVAETNGPNLAPTITYNLSKFTLETENKAKRKKRKKDKDRSLEHVVENNVEVKETSSASHTEVAAPNTFSNEQAAAEDQESEDPNGNIKKKKKKKKDKKTRPDGDADEQLEEGNHNSATDLNLDKNWGREHAPADIGAVDTDILKQASVNLGLPMADDGSKDALISAAPKKLKKKQKKKDKDKLKQSTTVKEPEGAQSGDTNPDSAALSHLRLWQSDRKSWKFNKRFQVRLIHNMYSSDKLGEEDFEILLFYLDGMQGKSREKTRDDAGKILTEDAKDADKIMQERARQVFQMLS